MTIDLPESYRAGRATLLRRAGARSLDTITRVHPSETAGDGRPLFLDTVWLGRRDAPRALLVICGTHGVEGYFGSAVMDALLSSPDFVAPPDTKIVLVHALNPYGFAWDRRVDENNVDVNRNFVDFANPPANPAYDALADRLQIADLSAASERAADAALWALTDTAHGAKALRHALSLGQYTHPDGLLFGGAAPSWSHAMLHDILREELRGVVSLTALDLHTGLGPNGACAILSDEDPDSATFARTKAVWPTAQACRDDDTVSPPTNGTVCMALAAARPGTMAVTIEVGTQPLPQIFTTLRRDAWIHAHGGAAHPQAATVAGQMRAAFAPNASEWWHKAWTGTLAAIQAALARL